MWLGPPCMNSHNTRFARGAKCVPGATPLAAPIAEKATAPMPPPACNKNWRRLESMVCGSRTV